MLVATPMAVGVALLAATATAGFALATSPLYWFGVMFHVWGIEDRRRYAREDEGEQVLTAPSRSQTLHRSNVESLPRWVGTPRCGIHSADVFATSSVLICCRACAPPASTLQPPTLQPFTPRPPREFPPKSRAAHNEISPG